VLEEQERLKRVQEEELCAARQRHVALQRQVQKIQAQREDLLAEEAAVAEDLLDHGDILMTTTVQGPALVEREDIQRFPMYKHPEEVYPQRMPPTREPRRTTQQAEKGVSNPVFGEEYGCTEFFYRYDLRMDDLPENTEVASGMLNLAEEVWSSIISHDTDAMIFPFLEIHQHESPPLMREKEYFPKTLMEFKRYFNRANPNTNGGEHWMSFLLAHNVPFESIKEEIGWQWREIKCMIWG